ncbi:unnamed protein product [Anisakis simplex]|uniref:Uncharacterized protein n=1 Tax=Anisakis simplex TaxID=6269 RepID=A0A0M3IYI1_ANISI|nr:unnamed protein product [Anisakis simplex]
MREILRRRLRDSSVIRSIDGDSSGDYESDDTSDGRASYARGFVAPAFAKRLRSSQSYIKNPLKQLLEVPRYI